MDWSLQQYWKITSRWRQSDHVRKSAYSQTDCTALLHTKPETSDFHQKLRNLQQRTKPPEMLQSILKPTLFNDDEQVRPKNHPPKKFLMRDVRTVMEAKQLSCRWRTTKTTNWEWPKSSKTKRFWSKSGNQKREKKRARTHTHTAAATETLREKTEHEIKSYLHEKAQISSFRDKIQELLEQCSRAQESSSISRPSKQIQCHEL
jgi:hypothetical protein